MDVRMFTFQAAIPSFNIIRLKIYEFKQLHCGNECMGLGMESTNTPILKYQFYNDDSFF